MNKRESRHLIVLFIPIVLFAGVLYVGAGKFAPLLSAQFRERRIEAIYASLRLDSTYIPKTTNVFGDKRPYPNDADRSQSSSITFVHPDTVSNTVADLKKRVQAAGFTYFEEPYPGSATVQYHYRNARGEYIRVSVSSKPRDDVIQNKFLMKQPLTADDYTLDFNAGPSDVTVKVNLDDNNE